MCDLAESHRILCRFHTGIFYRLRHVATLNQLGTIDSNSSRLQDSCKPAVEDEMNRSMLPTALSRIAFSTVVGLALLTTVKVSCASQVQDNQVEATLNAVVGLRALVPETARTAFSLGTERIGSGIVIDDEGLVLTIGYLVMESSDVEVTDSSGDYVPATLVAYDYDSGFGLVRAKGPLGLEGVSLGDSDLLDKGDAALIISHAGPDYLKVVEVVDVREFPGYWEYLLEKAIFTTPPYNGFGGAALINRDGELVGVGSLLVHDAMMGTHPIPGNMFVPINLIKPIFDDLLANGRVSGNSRPWLGVYTAVDRGHLFVTRVAIEGPAEAAGILPNDIIVAVNGNPVSTMASFLRQVWATGSAGVEVSVTIVRDGAVRTVAVQSGDRYDWLQLDAQSRYTAMLQLN